MLNVKNISCQFQANNNKSKLKAFEHAGTYFHIRLHYCFRIRSGMRRGLFGSHTSCSTSNLPNSNSLRQMYRHHLMTLKALHMWLHYYLLPLLYKCPNLHNKSSGVKNPNFLTVCVFLLWFVGVVWLKIFCTRDFHYSMCTYLNNIFIHVSNCN